MIKKALLIAALTGVVLTAGNAFAFSSKDSAAAPRPIPSSVVSPVDLPRSFNGGLINVEFTLDAAGQPRDIQVLHVGDPAVKRQVVAAFSHWRFEQPANATGAKRFILPLQVNPQET